MCKTYYCDLNNYIPDRLCSCLQNVSLFIKLSRFFTPQAASFFWSLHHYSLLFPSNIHILSVFFILSSFDLFVCNSWTWRQMWAQPWWRSWILKQIIPSHFMPFIQTSLETLQRSQWRQVSVSLHLKEMTFQSMYVCFLSNFVF